MGASEIEYLGYVNKTMSKEKREKVLQFALPQTRSKLQSFLGLANYFRGFIKDYASHIQPIQDLFTRTGERESIHWNADDLAAYHNVQDLIDNCPTLHFIHENAPIHVYTDASDYAIGAYVCQIIDIKQYPVAFIS